MGQCSQGRVLSLLRNNDELFWLQAKETDSVELKQKISLMEQDGLTSKMTGKTKKKKWVSEKDRNRNQALKGDVDSRTDEHSPQGFPVRSNVCPFLVLPFVILL